jgi:hypothetical protein
VGRDAQRTAINLYQKLSEEIINAAAQNEATRAQVLDILSIASCPPAPAGSGRLCAAARRRPVAERDAGRAFYQGRIRRRFPQAHPRALRAKNSTGFQPAIPK